MLIPEYQILFVHIPKTAGQSIENFLLHSLQKDRINHGREYLLCPNDNPSKGPERLAHLTVKDYVKYNYLKEEEYNQYFKFSMVRNPWSRVVSFYKFRGFHNLITFNRFVERYLPKYFEKENWFFRPQTDFIFDVNSNLLVDFLGKFELIETDFKKIIIQFDIPFSVLPKNNVSQAKKVISKKSVNLIKKHPEIISRLYFNYREKPYQELYNQNSKKIVSRLYEKDIDLLKYTF